jgi:small-conductance mechanosensitive channel
MRYLLAATLLVCVASLLALAHPRWPLWRRAIWRLVVFVTLTLLLQRILGSPLQPDYGPPGAQFEIWARFIEAAWWILAARGAVGIIRLLVVLEHRPRETQIISDLLAGAVYIATVLAVVNFAFQVPVRGLLATSGVIAIVLGLALQSTLSDVFSGIAVGIERPFKAGDLLWVEGGNIEGRVIQVNWRSTQIATGEGNIAVVPNSIIAKARLVNRSLPTLMRREKVELRVETGAEPGRCIATITAAVKTCRLLLETPAPVIECTSLGGDGNVFQVWFSVLDADHLTNARTELLTQLHRHLRHAGIALAIQGIAAAASVAPPTPAELLAQSDLFGVIEQSQRDLIAAHLTEIQLQPGETLIEQNATPSALFFVAAGTLEITIQTADQPPRVVHRMGPGESVGAIGLITGAAYAATATALTPLQAYRLDKAAIAAAITQMPALREGLEALAARGQALLHSDATTPQDEAPAHPDMFLAKLRGFLSLLGK